MSNAGFRVPGNRPTPPRKGFPYKWAFAGAAAIGLVALSQCEDKKQAPALPTPDPVHTPENVESYQSTFGSIYIVFNTDGLFYGAAAVDLRRATEEASDACIRAKNQYTACYGVKALSFGIGDMTNVKPTKMCVGIGVDYLKKPNRSQSSGEKPTEYAIVSAPSPREALEKINTTCDARAGNCDLGVYVYCNYNNAVEPHGLRFSR